MNFEIATDNCLSSVRTAVIATALFVSGQFNLSLAADVSCPERFSLTAPNAPTASQFEEVAKSLWPSGRRPIHGSNSYVGILTGPIVRGDYEKVLRLYRANHPFLNRFLLVSPGGDVDAALKSGRLFRKYLITASELTLPPALNPGEVGSGPFGGPDDEAQAFY
jgi:hypothetical protein